MIHDNKNTFQHKKSFSVSIFGIILYSILLIAVMAGAYFLISNVFAGDENSSDMKASSLSYNEVSENELSISSEDAPTIENETDEANLKEDLIDLSSIVSAKEYTIDYSVIHFEPATRDLKLTWKDTVFSKLENTKSPAKALINTYSMARKWATREDGKQMEFEIYTNPDSNKIEKIVAIEHCGDYLEILDYYYDNDKINYIDQRSMIINTPINISSADVTGRYYFNNDCLVKYSLVENDVAYEYTASNLEKYSDGTKSQYDYLEDTMLNWSYITLNAVPALVETQVIEGYVFDVFNSAMADANVQLISETTGNIVLKTTTDGNGLYNFTLPVSNDTYTIRIKKQTLTDANLYGVTAVSGSATYYAKPLYMSYSDNGATYNMTITLCDASSDNKPLSNATFTLREGLNSKSGASLLSASSDNAGAIIFSLQAGSYTGEIKKEGYETSYFPVIIKMDHPTAYGYTVPTLNDGEYYVVASWDNPTLDLDSLLFTADIPKSKKSNTDYKSGPASEAIKIEAANKGVYQYFLSDYTNSTAGDPMNYSLSTSNALVTVFGTNGYMASYSVPIAHGGVIWDVFRLRNGKLITTNYYYSVIDPLYTTYISK